MKNSPEGYHKISKQGDWKGHIKKSDITNKKVKDYSYMEK